MDVVGLYPNILHDVGLLALRKRLTERDKKDLFTYTLVDLAELVLKNYIFNFNQKILKQKRGTAIGTKFALPIVFYLWQNWIKKFLKYLIINHIYGGDIWMASFLSGNMEKKS